MTRAPDLYVVFETRPDEADLWLQRSVLADRDVAVKLATQMQQQKGAPVQMLVIKYLPVKTVNPA